MPLIQSGQVLPERLGNGRPVLDLVPQHCTRCDLWQDRRVALQCSRTHLFALAQTGDVAGRMLLESLTRAGEAAGSRTDRLPSARAALNHLQAAYAALAGAGANKEVLRPVFDDRLSKFLRGLAKHPDLLFGWLGAAGPRPMDDKEWARYLARVRVRVEAEDGEVLGSARMAKVVARGTSITLGRDELPDVDRDALPVLVVGGDLSPLERGSRAPAELVVVQVDSSDEPVRAPSAAPTWLTRLVDPRPDALLVRELLTTLQDGAHAPLLTEPFIIASDHEPTWPRAIVHASLAHLESEGHGRLREVEGVGQVLVLR